MVRNLPRLVQFTLLKDHKLHLKFHQSVFPLNALKELLVFWILMSRDCMIAIDSKNSLTMFLLLLILMIGETHLSLLHTLQDLRLLVLRLLPNLLPNCIDHLRLKICHLQVSLIGGFRTQCKLHQLHLVDKRSSSPNHKRRMLVNLLQSITLLWVNQITQQQYLQKLNCSVDNC